ncbi:family 78 glycoside hydrolase catalytic domain [Streptomyces sp. NPDC020845]|uniref:family 78 glycoside hydrolase catalytic domain n=1 Tax=Streptomyces sp. NPDC020845 TaxID=3365096 RepID=UPI0037AC82AE
MRAVGLQAAGLVDPLGLPDTRPTLTWRLEGSRRPDSVRVVVVDGADPANGTRLAVVDVAPSCHLLPWPAAPLMPEQQVSWFVRVSGANGESTSETAVIEAAPAGLGGARPITHPDWLGAESPAAFPELRRVFALDAAPVRARLSLAVEGVVAVEIAGLPALGSELDPGYGTPGGKVPAIVRDVTGLLRAGTNEITVRLGGGVSWVPRLTGRYTKFVSSRRPWAAARLTVETADGRTTEVLTDGTWDARLGATTVAHWYGGEDWREGIESAWIQAAQLPLEPDIRWRSAPPIRVVERLEPVSVTRRPNGDRLVDFGVNAAGRPVLTLTAAVPGRLVTLRPAELLDEEEAITQASTGSPIRDGVRPAGSAAVWRPSFVYHGARYWELGGLSPEEPDTVLGFETMRADNVRVGSLRTSDPFLDRLHAMVDRAVQSNMYSVFTDCPHREKLGWLEQDYLCFETLARGYDVSAHLRETVGLMREAQTPDGMVPTTVPELVVFDYDRHKDDQTAFRDDPNWGRALIEVPWRLYLHTGDTTTLREAWPAARRFLDHLRTRSVDGLLDHGLGDWIELDDSTPRGLVASVGWWEALRTATWTARLLGHEEAGARFEADARALRSRIEARFFRDGRWGSGSQASWAFGWLLAPDPAARQAAADALVGRIAADDGALTVGEIALPHFLRALAESGRSDLIDLLIRRVDAPGYGHQVASGATALTESWAGPQAPFGQASQNHFMLGMIDEWILGDVVGLRQHPESVGWARVRVKPTFLETVEWIEESFLSPRGRITVGWRRTAAGITLDVTAPPTVDVEILAPDDVVLSRNAG